ncbi:hypothetical protein PINS_up013609 [Pythium insidiosum]|nr:hypothetical protein PINS_up013609 [Pythium insidiosum]
MSPEEFQAYVEAAQQEVLAAAALQAHQAQEQQERQRFELDSLREHLGQAQKRDAETRELITNLLQAMTAQMTQHQAMMQHIQEGRAAPTGVMESAHFDLRVDLQLSSYSGGINESYELYHAGCVQFFKQKGILGRIMRFASGR